LVSAVISKATITSTIAVNTTVNIAVSAMSGSGYYLQFSTPVPYGKVVIALLGFDS
jgi:archaellin